jgi:hypothetical protein
MTNLVVAPLQIPVIVITAVRALEPKQEITVVGEMSDLKLEILTVILAAAV